MGACWARCFVGKANRRKYKSQHTYYFQRENTVEFADLTDEIESPMQEENSRLGSISSYLPFRHFRWTKLKENLQMDPMQRVRSVGMRLEDMESGPSESNANMQPLDALNLLRWEGVRVSSQTPPGSLDLEWENEAAAMNFSLVPSASEEDLLATGRADTHSNTVRSHGSSSNSLEWDTEDILREPLQGDFSRSQADAETEHLIQEIEKLTSKALQETGQIWHVSDR